MKYERLSQDRLNQIQSDLLVELGRMHPGEWMTETQPKEETHPSRHFKHIEGWGFYFHDDNDGRLSISGIWPIMKDGRQQFPSSYDGDRGSITVSASKSAESIVKDIYRRFLPVYLETWRRMKLRADGADRYEEQTQETVKAILKAEPFAYQPSRNNSSVHSNVLYFKSDKSHAYNVTAQGETVRFDPFNVPLEVALKVLEAMRK